MLTPTTAVDATEVVPAASGVARERGQAENYGCQPALVSDQGCFHPLDSCTAIISDTFPVFCFEPVCMTRACCAKEAPTCPVRLAECGKAALFQQ